MQDALASVGEGIDILFVLCMDKEIRSEALSDLLTNAQLQQRVVQDALLKVADAGKLDRLRLPIVTRATSSSQESINSVVELWATALRVHGRLANPALLYSVRTPYMKKTDWHSSHASIHVHRANVLALGAVWPTVPVTSSPQPLAADYAGVLGLAGALILVWQRWLASDDVRVTDLRGVPEPGTLVVVVSWVDENGSLHHLEATSRTPCFL